MNPKNLPSKIAPRSHALAQHTVYHLIVSHRTCYVLHTALYVHLNVSAKPRRIRMTHLRTGKLKGRAGASVSLYPLGLIGHRRRPRPKREPTGVYQPMDRSTLHPKKVCGLHHGSRRYGERGVVRHRVRRVYSPCSVKSARGRRRPEGRAFFLFRCQGVE